MRYPVFIIYFVLLTVTGFHFTQREPSVTPARKIRLVFHHQVGKEPLEPGVLVQNILGDSITIEKFKYYISNLTVTDRAGKEFRLTPQYFLIDEADPASKTITISIPDANPARIGFLLGVDSARNVSGIQTGVLDPLKGMFWTWNSGYIMAKLEGTAAISPSPGNRFTYHIGGFRFGMNAARKILLDLPQTGFMVQEININADINQWFKGASQINIAETPVCHSPGALAMRFADNYQNMFSIHSIR